LELDSHGLPPPQAAAPGQLLLYLGCMI